MSLTRHRFSIGASQDQLTAARKMCLVTGISIVVSGTATWLIGLPKDLVDLSLWGEDLLNITRAFTYGVVFLSAGLFVISIGVLISKTVVLPLERVPKQKRNWHDLLHFLGAAGILYGALFLLASFLCLFTRLISLAVNVVKSG